jgi:hypothetical protein
MIKKNSIINRVFLVIIILIPIGNLLGIISTKLRLPIILTLVGCQQLFLGFVIARGKNKFLRVFSIIIGVFFIISALFAILR